jgi:hypothetical protein
VFRSACAPSRYRCVAASAGNDAQNGFQVATLRLANTKLTICARQCLVASMIPAYLRGVHFASSNIFSKAIINPGSVLLRVGSVTLDSTVLAISSDPPQYRPTRCATRTLTKEPREEGWHGRTRVYTSSWYATWPHSMKCRCWLPDDWRGRHAPGDGHCKRPHAT